jgi:hypothetical protein
LAILRRSGLGVHIGDLYFGSPTCADDVLLLSFDSDDLQIMLDLTEDFSNKRRYILNASKSNALTKHFAPKHAQSSDVSLRIRNHELLLRSLSLTWESPGMLIM